MKEEIKKVLKNKYDALSLIEINDLLNLETAEDLKVLSNTLEELEKEYVVYKTKKDKYILYDNNPGVKAGKISINKTGNGYLLLEGDDLYINYHNLNNAVDGDTVLVETEETAPVTIAANEIVVGKVKIVEDEKEKTEKNEENNEIEESKEEE